MALSHSPSIVTDGLVLCLDAANLKSYPGSGTSLFDLSQNKNNGTLINGPSFNSSNGGYLSFDGVDDYVLLGETTLYLGNNIQTSTISQWIYTSGVTAATTCAFKRSSTSSLCRTMINENDTSFGTTDLGRIGFLTRNNANTATVALTTTSVSFQNRWINLVCIIDGLTRSLYINGSFITSDSGVGMQSITSSTGTTTLGSFINDSPIQIFSPFTGNISNTLVYKRSLNASEVLQNFNALRGRFGI